VLAVKAENIDLTKLALDVMIVAKRNRLGAAFQLLRWTSCYFCKEEGSRFETVGINRGKDHVSGVDTSFKGCQFSSSRASAMFLREEVIMKVLNFTVIVPAELPYGEQMRVQLLFEFHSNCTHRASIRGATAGTITVKFKTFMITSSLKNMIRRHTKAFSQQILHPV